MKRFSLLRYIAPGITILLLLFGCSGGSGGPTSPDLQDGARDIAGAVLTLGSPVDAGTDEICIPVEYSEAADLYSFSFRVGFDPEGLEPVGVEWGGFVRDEDSCFHMLNRGNFVPLAFARFDGIHGIDGSGTMCTLRFRIRDRERIRAWIIENDNFLVARNSFGHHLRLRVGGEGR